MTNELITKRRSFRRYLGKDVEDSKIEEVIRAGMYAPSAMNKRPCEFIVVKDKEKIKQLAGSTMWSDFAGNAPVVLVLGASENNSKHWIEDVSIAASYIYLETVNQGLGTCWIQIYMSKDKGMDAEEYVRRIIGADKEFRILCLMPVGYPDEIKTPHKEDEYDEKRVHKDMY